MAGILKQINRSNGGLPKRAINGAVLLNEGGVEGDRQRNLKYHGGPAKAVLMVSAEFVDCLQGRGFPVFYGALGENLTVSGLDPHMWRAGQRYGVGDTAVIELNEWTLQHLTPRDRQLVIVPGATHLFEEPGALEEVARLAADWLARHLSRSALPTN